MFNIFPCLKFFRVFKKKNFFLNPIRNALVLFLPRNVDIVAAGNEITYERVQWWKGSSIVRVAKNNSTETMMERCPLCVGSFELEFIKQRNWRTR